jgi:endonuclease YncB( thermonuclease family)
VFLKRITSRLFIASHAVYWQPMMTRYHWIGLISLGFLFAAPASYPHESRYANGKVIKVLDGDTVLVDIDGRHTKLELRMYGIDCPEGAWPEHWPAQPKSEQAKTFTERMVRGRRVTIRLTGDRSYHRQVGEIFVDGLSLSRELVRAGLAWWNKRYAPHDLDLARLEAIARRAHKGIWNEPKPVPPWLHRHKDRRSVTR